MSPPDPMVRTRPVYKTGMTDRHRLNASLQAALAAEIRDLRLLVEEIAAVIVGDQALAMKHHAQLQGFDLVIQRAEESARLLDSIAGGTCPRAAVEAVRLSTVQDRLRAALRAA